jgi:uroporphyrinogen decarboxylase
MNSRDRTLAALRCEQPDRVPIFELHISQPTIVELVEFLTAEPVVTTTTRDEYGEEAFEVLDLYCFVIEEMGLDATCSSFSMGLEPIGNDLAQDKYGTVYRLSEHGSPMPVAGPISDPPDIKGFDMASRLEADDFAGVRYVIETVGSDKAHIMSINDPFKVSWRLRGSMQNLLLDYTFNPRLVHELGRIATDFNKAAIEEAVALGVDAIIVPGDLAGEETLLISPEHFREYILPYEEEMVDYAHQCGLSIIKHTDGNAWLILDDFVEAGFDGFHPVQPQCMDIAEVKQHLAGKACILGNIDCRNLLPFGTPEQVEQSVQDTIAAAAPGGGYIISSSNSIHPACQTENYLAMVKAAHQYGRYT